MCSTGMAICTRLNTNVQQLPAMSPLLLLLPPSVAVAPCLPNNVVGLPRLLLLLRRRRSCSSCPARLSLLLLDLLHTASQGS